MRPTFLIISVILSITVHPQQIAGGAPFRQQMAAAFQNSKNDLLAAGRQLGKLGEDIPPGVAFSGNTPFGIKNLGNYSLVFCYPGFGGSFLLGTDFTKSGDYNAMQTGIAYGMRFAETLSGGIKINYYSQSIRGYKGFKAFPVEASVLYTVTSKLQTGISFYNLVSVFRNKNVTERLPVFSAVGWRYQFSKVFTGALLISKEESGIVIFNPALSIQMSDAFYFCSGYETGLSNWMLSAGYYLQGFNASIHFSIHPYLGLSGGMSIQWTAEK